MFQKASHSDTINFLMSTNTEIKQSLLRESGCDIFFCNNNVILKNIIMQWNQLFHLVIVCRTSVPVVTIGLLLSCTDTVI